MKNREAVLLFPSSGLLWGVEFDLWFMSDIWNINSFGWKRNPTNLLTVPKNGQVSFSARSKICWVSFESVKDMAQITQRLFNATPLFNFTQSPALQCANCKAGDTTNECNNIKL
ncbi:hypothetical protein CEXT_430321 [Caerostris extrusa]|uniref:Uncharacterized protein n=1 Tax=Caerostris extrusa TaxID=172846 RepID=A0AAV4YEF6_CAEEX|nr:hypothetical protein CEXT_430321 [Caerostris extrusa]